MLITDTKRLADFSSGNRLWQGIPGIERTKGGRLFSTFYSGGTAEQLGNYAVLLQSDDDGATFSQPVAAAYLDDEHRCYDSCLWIDPLGRLWFTWGVMPGHAVWAAVCPDPDAPTLTWGDPVVIGHDVMMNKPTVLSTGEWLFPIAVWNQDVYVLKEYATRHREQLSFAYMTNDNGRTFQVLGGADVPRRSFDEHQILELSNGTLLMLVRTTYGIGKSYSYDRGHTWTPGEDSGIAGPCSRFFLRRLTSGNVLLVNHYHFKGRNNLTAMISADECQTWQGFLLLDERDNVSYPDGVQGDDGFIYITYDRERGGFLHDMDSVMASAREILMAKVTEQDILAGKLVNPQSRLKCIISKLGEYTGPNPNPFGEFGRYTQDEFIEAVLGLGDVHRMIEKVFDRYDNCCINLRDTNRTLLDESIEGILSGCMDGDGHRLRFTLGKIIDIFTFAGCSTDPDAANHVMERTFAYVGQNIRRDFTLDEIAAQMKISKFYLCHLFRKKTGTTIMRYKNSRRVALAKKLLVGTDLFMLDICAQVGFGDSSYFAKWFKKEEGITPVEYRKWNRLKKT